MPGYCCVLQLRFRTAVFLGQGNQMNIEKLSASIALFTLVIGYSVGVFAQGRASLTGSISDEVGASIVGAMVTLTSAEGAQRTTTSSADGTYSFSGLTTGKYRVRVSAK